MKITWITERGTDIKLTMDEAKEINADGHKVTTTGADLTLTANGKPVGYQGLVDHSEVGLAIQVFGGHFIPVPDDKADEVKNMADEHKRRLDEANRIEREHDEWAAKIEANR
jgi:hypothetical protein